MRKQSTESARGLRVSDPTTSEWQTGPDSTGLIRQATQGVVLDSKWEACFGIALFR